MRNVDAIFSRKINHKSHDLLKEDGQEPTEARVGSVAGIL